MNTLFRWMIPFFIIVVAVFYIVYYAFAQNLNITTASEIEVLAETISVGMVRAEVEEGKNFRHFDKEELEADLISKVAEVQKNHKYTIKLNYMFLDLNGTPTGVEDDIRGIQFHIQYLDKKNEVRGNAERRLTLNYLE